MQYKCNMSETRVTQVQHKCNTSAAQVLPNDMSATRVKNFDFDNDLFSH